MPAYVWITAVAAVLTVLWAAFVRRWWHSLWYSWRHSAHVIDASPAEILSAGEFVGSMNLDDEPGAGWLLAPLPVEPEPWLEQTRADLAPEALDVSHEEIVLPAYGGWISGPCLDPDPGPGGGEASSLVPPGPEQSEWLATQMALLYVWVRSCHGVTP